MRDNAGLRSNRNFLRYFSARIISQLGDQMYVFAVSWYVMDLTRSSFHMAALLALNSFIVMAVSPFGGLTSDRVSRKRVMVVTDLIQGIVLLALLAALRGGMPIVALYAATVILGLCSASFSPAASAIVPGIVSRESVPQAVAAGQAGANLCTIVGMVTGGVLYRIVGITGILALNAVSNLLAALMESRIRVATASPAASGDAGTGSAFGRLKAQISDGARQIRADRNVSAFLLINAVFSFVVLPIPMVYLPYFFNVIVDAAPLQAALAQAGSWIGIIFGSVVAGRLLRSRRPESVIASGLLSISLTTFLFVFIIQTRHLLGTNLLTLICTLSNALAGGSGAFFIVPLYAFFHARSQDEFRGRFWGVEAALRTAATCGGFFVAGVLAHRLSLDTVFAGMALLMFGMFLWTLGLRKAVELQSMRAGDSGGGAH